MRASDRCYDKALQLLALRAHFSAQLAAKLRQRGFLEGEIEDALSRLREVGYLDDTLTHTPQTVVLSRHYVNPVVFAQPPSRDGSDVSVIRVRDVQSDRFKLYVDEAPNHGSGTHTTEAVSYRSAELAPKPGAGSGAVGTA